MTRGEEFRKALSLEEQEKDRRKHLEQLRTDTIRKIDFLDHKVVIDYHDVYRLIREFFKEFLGKRYEFTINELKTELRKVYISSTTRPLIEEILECLETGEYLTVHYKRPELQKLLVDFRKVVEQLIRTHTARKSFIDHLKSFFFKEPDPQSILSELPVIEGNDQHHKRLYILIERCYAALDQHNLHRAKASYEALLVEYNRLSERERAEYYPVVHQTYQDLVSRATMLHA
jgi:hypothetical protein